MKLKTILEDLPVNSLHAENLLDQNEFAAIEINGCYIGDLLSNVMAHAQTGDLWLTVQTHQNVVAIAQLLNLAGIVFLEGHLPQEETIARARSEKIPLFCTNEGAYEFARRLYKLGLERTA